MKLAIMQPYFLPYIGYWQLLHSVDTFVVYDDVTYIKGGWINRNNILVGEQKHLFTIKLNGASSFKLINQVGVLDSFSSFLKTLQMNYSRAPYYEATIDLMQKIVAYDKSNLAMFIANSFSVIAAYLSIDTKLIISSALEKNNALKAQDKVIEICKRLGATDYYNAIGGTELYDKESFQEYGISLRFLQTHFTPYKQFRNEFIPGLSILDILMFNSTEEIKRMLEDYSLV